MPVVLMAQLLAAAVFTLTLVWVLHFRGGVSWEMSSNPQLVYTVKQLYSTPEHLYCWPACPKKGKTARVPCMHEVMIFYIVGF
jgi:hypothetical protein